MVATAATQQGSNYEFGLVIQAIKPAVQRNIARSPTTAIEY